MAEQAQASVSVLRKDGKRYAMDGGFCSVCQKPLRSENRSGRCSAHGYVPREFVSCLICGDPCRKGNKIQLCIAHRSRNPNAPRCITCSKILKSSNKSGYCRGHRDMSPEAVERRKIYAQKHRPQHLDMDRKRRTANREKIAALKVQLGCVECGYNAHPEALDFDHLPGGDKISDISKLINRSWSRILAEIAKCEVVCANCHRVRSANRRKKASV